MLRLRRGRADVMLPQNILSFSASCSLGDLMIPKDSIKSAIGSHRDSFQTSVSVDCQLVQLVSLQTFCCSQGWCFRRLISACSTTTWLRQPLFLSVISKVSLHSNFCMHKPDKESCVLCDRSNPPILEGLPSTDRKQAAGSTLAHQQCQGRRRSNSSVQTGTAAPAARAVLCFLSPHLPYHLAGRRTLALSIFFLNVQFN